MQNRFEHITLPTNINVNGAYASVLTYDNKRQEASLGDGRFDYLRWPMTPENWHHEQQIWIARGATNGATLYSEPQYGAEGRIGDWGWVRVP